MLLEVSSEGALTALGLMGVGGSIWKIAQQSCMRCVCTSFVVLGYLNELTQGLFGPRLLLNTACLL